MSVNLKLAKSLSKSITQLLKVIDVLRKQNDAAFKIMTPEQQAIWLVAIQQIKQQPMEEE